MLNGGRREKSGDVIIFILSPAFSSPLPFFIVFFKLGYFKFLKHHRNYPIFILISVNSVLTVYPFHRVVPEA